MYRILATLAGLALLLAGALGGASSAGAAPKPGFLPGVWLGQGTIKGSIDEYGMSTIFNGRVAFTLKVSPKLAVSGSGSWKLDMLGVQDAPSDYGVDTTTVGTAAIGLSGTATNVGLSGMQHIEREIRSGGRSTRMAPLERPLSHRLVITRAGKCRVAGTTQIQPGVTLTWSAKLKGSGTCNA
jgi:hypothetical protein